MKKIKLMALLLVSMLSINLWGADEPQTLLSFSRSGSNDSYTTDYTLTKAVEGKTDYYQDGSGDVRYLQLKQTSVLFSSAPTSVTVEATLGGGTTKDSLTNNVYACFVDKDGNNITGSAVTLTTKITNTTGSSFSASMSTSLATSAYGLKIYHQKESGYNVRYYSFSLKYIKATDPGCTSTLTAPEVVATPGDKQIVLTWDAVTDATGYKIFKNTAEVGTTTNTTYTLTGLTNKTSYAWQVVAIGNGTTICDSEPASGNATPNTIYTLNYSIAGVAGSVNATDGSSIVASLPSSPTSCSLESNAFQGWTTASSVQADGSDFIPVSGNVDATAASKTYTAVWAKEIIGEEESIAGGDMSNGAPDAWSKYSVDKYSNNGVKFDDANDSIASPDLSENNAKSVTVKMKAGHNGGSGSVLTISAWSQTDKLIDSKTCIPTEAYTSQNTTYEYTLSGSDVIAKVSVKMTSKTKNLGMKYFEVFAKEVSLSKFITYCCEEHNVTLTDNGTKTGGSFSADIVKACEGKKITLSYNEATGYEFKGWTITPNTVEINGDNEFNMPNGDVTIDASFDLIPYTITYEKNGGNWTGAEGVASYTYGTGATLPTADDITKANNTFLGWYVTNPAEIVTSIGATETGDKSFIASWLPSGARDVTYSGDDQLVYTSNPQIVDKDDPSLTVTYSVNKGYTISTVTVAVDGNTLTAEGEVVFSDEQLVITPTNGFSGDVTIAFIVMDKEFNVTWMANGTQFGAIDQVKEGNKVTLPTSTPADVEVSTEETYKFQGWIVDEQYSSETIAPDYIEDNTIEPTGDVTYYAVYAIEEKTPSTTTYTRVTEESQLQTANSLVIVNNSASKLFTNALGTATAPTESNGEITVNNTDMWSLSYANSKYTISNASGTLGAATMPAKSSGNYNKPMSITSSNNSWTIAESGTDLFVLKNANNVGIEYYSSNWVVYINDNIAGVEACAHKLYIPKMINTTKNYRTRVAVIDHIAVHEAPLSSERTNLVAGETFDATGLSIDVYYKDEDVPTNVTSGFTYAPTTALATTDTKVTFTYQGKTADVTINVSNTVSGIAVTTKPSKMVYTEGEQFNPEGMVVTATYDNEAERVVTDYDYEPKGDLALDDKITISFGEQTTDLNITINPATKTTVNWYVNGVKLTEGEQSTAVIPGKKVAVLPTEPEACQGNQFVGWTTQETYYNATTAPSPLFKTLADAPVVGESETNYYAVFAQVTSTPIAESTVYTSNIDNEILDEGIKIGGDETNQVVAKHIGTSKTPTGSLRFDVPAGTTTITLHAVAWKDKSNVTITMSTEKAGVVITPSDAQAVSANDGAANSSPYSITPADGDFYTFTLSGVTEETEVTISNATERVVLWGINTATTITSDYSTTCLAALAAPTISTTEGEYCGSVDVEITQPAGNPEGAKIMYSTDNTNWSEYSTAVKLTTSGTIYAKVVKDPKSTEVVSATYTVYPAYTLAQAATAASATSQIACLTFTDLLVQARSLSEAFLKASDGQIVLLNKSSHGLQVGDKLSANDAHVTFVKAHDLLQLTSTEGIAAATTGNATTPEEKAITALEAADYGKLVKIMNVTYDATNKKFTDVSSNEIAVDGKFFPSGIPTSWPDGGKFNVTGIVLTNGDNVVIAPRNGEDLESLATPLPAPTNFAVASVNSYQASYSWTAVEGNNGYTLYVYDGDNQVYKSNTIGSTRTDYAPTTALTANHTYTAKLVALGDKAISSDSPAAEVTFTTNPNAQLNWYVGGTLYQTTNASQEKVVTPEDPESPCATNYENFVTWYTEEIVSETGQITALDAAKKVKAGDAAASEAGSAKEYNFYAVFGKIKTAGTDKYVKVTEAPDNWKGEYLIGYDEGEGKESLTVFDGSRPYDGEPLDDGWNIKTITFDTDGSIKAADGQAYQFTFNVIEGNTISICSASNYYISNTTAENKLSSDDSKVLKNTISWEENSSLEIASAENQTQTRLCFNPGSGTSSDMRFRYYKNTSYNANLVLYKRTKTNPQYSGYITTCPVTYTITIANNAKGLVEAATTTEILKGAKVLLTATANAGYTKTGGAWVVKKTATSEVVEDLVGPTNYLTMPDYNVTVDYNFIAKTDNFVDNLHNNETKTAQGGGTEYVIPELDDETKGTACAAYYIFDGWVTEQIFSDAPAQNDDMKVNPTYAEGNTYYALWMGEDGFITDCCNTPIPENLKALSTYLKATSAKLDWDNVPDATKYHIIVKQGETTLYDTDVEKSEFEITSGLTKETTYDVYVKAYAGCWSENVHIQFTTAAEIKSYSVTINAEGGTYELLADPEMEGNKIQEGAYVVIGSIAVTDPDHYFFKELTIEPEVSDLEESEGTYSFTMPSKAITINIVFAEYPTITWKMAGAADQTSTAVRQDDKFVVGTVKAAPDDWKYKAYFPEFAGWVTSDKCDANGNVTTAEFITAATEVPAAGLTVYGAVAKSAKADMTGTLTKVIANDNIDANAYYIIGADKNGTDNTQYYFIELGNKWGVMNTVDNEDNQEPMLLKAISTTGGFSLKNLAGSYIDGCSSKTFTMSENASTLSLSTVDADKSAIQYYNSSGNKYWKLRHNYGTAQGIRWYDGTTGVPSYLYKVALVYENLTINPQPDYGRNDLVVGNYGTVCVPYAVKITDRSGATFWNIETSNAPGSTNPTSVTIVQEEGDLEAGKPYIFYAEETTMSLFFSGEEYKLEEHENATVPANGLYGNLTDANIIINPTEYVPGYFFVLQQKLYECGVNCIVGPNRGWVQAAEIQNMTTPSPAPRRVIGNPNGTPTGINNLNVDGWVDLHGAHKYFRNGTIIIVKEGQFYNAQGIKIK